MRWKCFSSQYPVSSSQQSVERFFLLFPLTAGCWLLITGYYPAPAPVLPAFSRSPPPLTCLPQICYNTALCNLAQCYLA